MYIRSKKVLCASIAAAMIFSSGTAIARADKSYDSTNVGIISQVDEFIETRGDRAVEDLTGNPQKTEVAEAAEVTTEAEKKAPESEKKAEPKKEETKYAQFKGKAVAVCETELNIRTKKDADAEVVGTLARYGICNVKEKGAEWTEIESGSCKGYVRTEYLKFGDDAAKWYLDNGFSEVVTVDTDTLTLRGEADIDSECLGMVGRGESYDILERGKGWTKIKVDDELEGYVNNNYIEIGFKTVKAVSVEEQQAALRAEEEKDKEEADKLDPSINPDEEKKAEAKDAAPENEEDADKTDSENSDEAAETEEDKEEVTEEEAEEATEEDTEEETEEEADEDEDESEDEYDEDESEDEDEDYDDEEESEESEEAEEERSYAAPAGQAGQDIVDYALQFVGNPYVWGGTSLTNGADCSGFVYTIYADFGYSLPRCADDQALVGTEVGLSELEPGDLLFYGDDSIGHVAMYIGGGQIVHAASSSQGIITQNYDYHTPCKAVRIVNQ